MGLASLSLDAVPSSSLTPQEPLVESLRVALQQDTTLVLNNSPQDKTFLFTLLVKVRCHSFRHYLFLVIRLHSSKEFSKDFIKVIQGTMYM